MRPTQPWMQEARACILRLGGIPQMNTYAKLYLALLGQFPWKYLPTVPVEIVFFPQLVLLQHLRAVVVEPRDAHAAGDPQSLQAHAAAPGRTSNCTSCIPSAPSRRSSACSWQRPRLFVAEFFPRLRPRCSRSCTICRGSPGAGAALAQAEAWMIERMGEGSDGLGAIFPAMLNALIALKTLALSRRASALREGAARFRGALRR